MAKKKLKMRLNAELYWFIHNINTKSTHSFRMDERYFFDMPDGACVILSKTLFEDFVRQRDMAKAG